MKKTHLSPAILILLVALIVACTSHFGLNKKNYATTKDKAKTFWKWFKTNEVSISPNDDVESNKELGRRLTEFKRGMTYVLDTTESRQKQLTLSCGGNKELVPFIEVLYQQKPKLKNWNIQLYMQAGQIPDSLQYDERLTLHAKDFEMYLKKKDHQVLIIVAMEHMKVSDIRNKLLVQQYIVRSLGEEVAIKYVSSVMYQDISMVDVEEEPFYIYDLKDRFEALFEEE